MNIFIHGNYTAYAVYIIRNYGIVYASSIVLILVKKTLV